MLILRTFLNEEAPKSLLGTNSHYDTVISQNIEWLETRCAPFIQLLSSVLYSSPVEPGQRKGDLPWVSDLVKEKLLWLKALFNLKSYEQPSNFENFLICTAVFSYCSKKLKQFLFSYVLYRRLTRVYIQLVFMFSSAMQQQFTVQVVFMYRKPRNGRELESGKLSFCTIGETYLKNR